MDLEEDQTGLNSLSAFSDDSERFDDVLKGRFLELELERKILLKIWTYYVTGENHSHHGGLTFEKVETVKASKLSSGENTAFSWREWKIIKHEFDMRNIHYHLIIDEFSFLKLNNSVSASPMTGSDRVLT